MEHHAVDQTAIEEQDEPLDIWKPDDFETRYYFLNYMRIVLEQCGSRFVHKHFLEVLEDRHRLDIQDHNLGHLNWRQADGVELSNYIKLFRLFVRYVDNRKTFSPFRLEYILDRVYAARNSAIHGENITDDDLATAMTLPEILNEADTTRQLQNFKDWIDFVSPSVAMEEAKKAFWNIAFPPSTTTISTHQILEMMRLTTSKIVFDYLSREDPEVLRWLHWTCFEQVEICKLRYIGWSNALKGLGVNPMVKLRNTAVHRNLTYKCDIQEHVLAAIEFALKCDHPVQAVEIEVYAEQYFTKGSREEVLKRLSGAAAADDPALYGEGRIADRQRAVSALLATPGMFSAKEKAEGDQAYGYTTLRVSKRGSDPFSPERNDMTSGHASAVDTNDDIHPQSDDLESKVDIVEAVNLTTAACPKWPASMNTELTDIEVWVNVTPLTAEQREALEAEFRANLAYAPPGTESPPSENILQENGEQSEPNDAYDPDWHVPENDELPMEDSEEEESSEGHQECEKDSDDGLQQYINDWSQPDNLAIEISGDWYVEDEYFDKSLQSEDSGSSWAAVEW